MADELSIQDLCDQTGLPRRTIHFYTQQGILPPPQGAGAGAYYQAEHLLRLKLIPVLRRQGLRLDEIRQKFDNTPLTDLQQVLDHTDLPAAPPENLLRMRAKAYQSYLLPDGIILMLPENATARAKARLESFLQSFQ